MDYVRPKWILNAIRVLIDKPVFKQMNITISDQWLNDSNNGQVDKIPFVVDPNDYIENNNVNNQNNNELAFSQNDQYVIKQKECLLINETEDDYYDENPMINNAQIHETMVIDEAFT